MATNTDFNTLIGRIDKATTTLENNVSVLVQSSTDVTQSVTEAKTYANAAKQSETLATQKANTATEQASKATTEATKATNEATKAINAVEQAKALAPFQEAPKDGGIYGRKNGAWTLVENSSSGNTPIINAVKSVNNITPDVNGNVTINIPTPTPQVNSDWNATSGKAQILNKPTLFNGDYNNLTNKPTIPTKTSDLENDSEFIDYNSLNIELIKKQDKLSSFDESILIEEGGNIESNVSLFQEYFNQQVCELNFTPIQIIGIYVNGIKQRPSSYVITLPKTISVTNFTSGDYIEIQYTKLKN